MFYPLKLEKCLTLKTFTCYNCDIQNTSYVCVTYNTWFRMLKVVDTFDNLGDDNNKLNGLCVNDFRLSQTFEHNLSNNFYILFYSISM